MAGVGFGYGARRRRAGATEQHRWMIRGEGSTTLGSVEPTSPRGKADRVGMMKFDSDPV